MSLLGIVINEYVMIILTHFHIISLCVRLRIWAFWEHFAFARASSGFGGAFAWGEYDSRQSEEGVRLTDQESKRNCSVLPVTVYYKLLLNASRKLGMPFCLLLDFCFNLCVSSQLTGMSDEYISLSVLTVECMELMHLSVYVSVCVCVSFIRRKSCKATLKQQRATWSS